MKDMLKNKCYSLTFKKVCLLNKQMLFSTRRVGKQYQSVKYCINWLCSKCKWRHSDDVTVGTQE